ncbi:MAG TPA: HDIG domain-containing protein, partial [Bacteroidales bacterium]|nr:HDIG domain-containing protein [Bacteroidales bacterium]
MKTFFRIIKENLNNIFKAFLFLLTIGILVYLFPREGKFRYEFQKGKPWMHEVLIAPFDFPIYKSEAEITKERDSILKQFTPYFLYDSTVLKNEIKAFDQSFATSWNRYVAQTGNGSKSLQKLEDRKNRYREFGEKILTFVYEKGILESTDVIDQEDNTDADIVVVSNNIAKEQSLNEVFTQKSAYEYIVNQINQLSDQVKEDNDPEEANYLKQLNMNEFIAPNLFYDQTTSEAARQSLLNELSLTKGMVQAGERIVSKGELVNSDNYRILESLKTEYEKKLGGSADFYLVFIGQVILVFISVLVLFLFLLNFRKEILQDTLKTSFILLLVVLIAFAASMTLRYSVLSIYIVPFALVPIIIKTFYDSRLALFIHIITVLLVGFWAPNGFEFVFLNIIAGIVAIFSLTNMYRRGKLFLSAVLVIASYSVIYLGIAIIQEADFSQIDWKTFLWFSGNGLLVLTSYPLIYIFEKIFGFLSDATLMELSDTNQPLLRKLAEKAPGTFQHSMQVANLAEEAIFKIGGNTLLVRTGALYHDIGKMDNPLYFIENQTSDINPHDHLEFDQSAEIIINHVAHGVEIAKKYNLPQQIVDFIRTHHGTTAVQYFYRSYLKKYPEKKVDINKFTYPGPRPFTKEMAVVMMADSVEAASRSLKNITLEAIHDLVENIINYQMIEEQFNNADITFKDITTI